MATTLKPFGTAPNGDTVTAHTISGHGLSATILSLGCILQDVRLDGVPHSLTLGSDRLSDYLETMPFHGSIVGPVANRLTNGTAPIAGVPHQFERNLAGQHTLHSGTAGTQTKIWRVVENSDATTPHSITFLHNPASREGGFPGDRQMTATFTILPGPALTLRITTTTSGAPSLINATNHSYWNLDGSDNMRGHTLHLAADHYLPSDANFIPTGDIAAVDGTPFDFRAPKPLIPGTPPLDNTFCVAHARGPLTDRMTLTGASGITMTVATTEPGVHLYDGRAAQRPGRPFYEGLAVECQGWPDAPNKPGFPSIEVHPDAPVIQITQWRFAQDG